MKKAAVIAGCLFLILSSHDGSAQNSEKGINLYLYQNLSPGTSLERYVQKTCQDLSKLDADQNGILDMADAEIHRRVGAATFRAEFGAHMMMYDLDGDKTVTEEELRQRFEYELRSYAVGPYVQSTEDARMKLELKNFAAADTNHDGRVTWDEAIELAKKRPDFPRAGLAPTLSARSGIWSNSHPPENQLSHSQKLNKPRPNYSDTSTLTATALFPPMS